MNKVEIKNQAWRNELYKQLQESVMKAGIVPLLDSTEVVMQNLIHMYDDD